MYLPCINNKDDDDEIMEHIKNSRKGFHIPTFPLHPPSLKASPFDFIQIRQRRWLGADEKPPKIKIIHFLTLDLCWYEPLWPLSRVRPKSETMAT